MKRNCMLIDKRMVDDAQNYPSGREDHDFMSLNTRFNGTSRRLKRASATGMRGQWNAKVKKRAGDVETNKAIRATIRCWVSCC